MNIYVYSDESGVFDVCHNKYFVYGGLILLGNNEKDNLSRKYASIEKTYKTKNNKEDNFEIKSTTIGNKDKNNIFRSLNSYHKFATIIKQEQINDNIWKSKKDKQRYLDFAYKITVKKAFAKLIEQKCIRPNEVENIYFFVDEHSTATNGRYELREALEQELKYGSYNWNYQIHYSPIFRSVKSINVEFCDSSAPNKRLVRASDIIANKVYYLATNGKIDDLNNVKNMFYIIQP